ncbi:MAG: ABC transporter permease, partial [Chitinophagaceae bacterium]
MLTNYIKIALRNLKRHKAYSMLNIAGLAIGMACSILILLWVQQEQSYDRFHTNASHLFRLRGSAGDFHAAVSPAGMGAGLQRELPQVKAFVRLSHLQATLFEHGNTKLSEKNTFYADSNFLDIFSFELAAGNRQLAMSRPDAVIITEEMAMKYFGTKNAVGKTLKRNNRDLVTVTGVFNNIPSASHLQFDFIMPIAAIAGEHNDLKTNTWDNFNFYTYLLLDQSVVAGEPSVKALEKQINRIYQEHQKSQKINFFLQPLTEIHLLSNLQVDLPGHGNKQYVSIFLIVAIFILVVACINFMNLATARSARRAREVGIRKVAGAT